MPFAILKSIREVSSEDKLHSASNLLRNEPAKKWKTGEPGENSSYVIIEMEKEYLIKGIDIGNECSAFVEVLVGGATTARENFKEILITCSFMTPSESRTCSMPNRVRCFGREALVEEVASQKWKLIKIVCSQPFNKTINYGLSFIKIHVDEVAKTKPDAKENSEPPTTTLLNRTFGSYHLREESPDSESESTTSLFNRWKTSKNKQLNGASSVPRIPSPTAFKKLNESPIVRKPTTSSAKKVPSDESPTINDRNRDSLLFTDEDDEQSVQNKRKKKLEKLEKVIAADQERVKKEIENANKKTKKHDSPKVPHKREEKTKKDDANNSHSEKTPKTSSRSPKKPSTPSTSTGQRRPSSSPCVSDKPKKPKLDKPVQYKPFNQLLSGVVLVISGIQNPDRADLRNKALALGAKYRADWDNSSTHLICAFKNTPKYNQVKGIGKIVTRNWIEDCYSKKRKLPWRRYALDSAETSKAESDDEILDESLKPQDDVEPSIEQQRISIDSADDILPYDMETNNSQCISSGSDTEDEIQKVLAKKTSPKKPIQAINRDIFEVSTEEEDYVTKRKLLSDKTKFFNKMKFFISDQLSATIKIKVEQYIETFDGVLTKSLDDADYLIANNPVADVGQFKGETVTPLWILECNDSECLIPTKRYLVK